MKVYDEGAYVRITISSREGDRIDSVEIVRGWCARYSAPGYMDCTSWCGPYATEDEALRECREQYGDEDEDEEGEDDEELYDGQESVAEEESLG